MNRCGYCYQRGHNRQRCPQLKEYCKQNPNSYVAELENRRKEQRAVRGPRKCSYCSEGGHNKKTCVQLKEDRRKVSQQIRVWRQKFLSIAKENGFGIGTLVKINGHRDEHLSEWLRRDLTSFVNRAGEYGIVMQLREDQLDHRQIKTYGYNQDCCLIRFPGGQKRVFPLPSEFKQICGEKDTSGIEIVGTIDSSNIEDLFSQKWHEGIDTPDKHLGLT